MNEHHSLSQAYQTYLSHDKKEQAHWEDVCHAYRQYATFALCSWANQCHRFDALPESQRRLLPPGLIGGSQEFDERAKLFKDAAIRNQFCLDCILRHAGMPHSQQVGPTTTIVGDGAISKVSSVLKSLARDWSVEGKGERDMAYEPILNSVMEHVPIGAGGAHAPKICVPGAGVGRLALELTALGYRVQGNEFSLFMLLASDFILNSGVCTTEKPMEISPWLFETRNMHSPTDPIRKIVIPDINPSSYLMSSEDDNDLTPPDFSMAAGDFCGIYGSLREESQWNAIVCCFFLDAAPSIVEYIQVIHKMLKPGGHLINFGPLLYHWSGPAMRPDDRTREKYQSRFSYLDSRYMSSVDMSWEDVRHILVNAGFDIVEERVGVRTLYTADRRSMMNMAYRCIHFVAKKRETELEEMNDG
eukprot:CAMPEP_0194222340 /NCGR_PEP_ID=MMETSP0156-20130528/32693_1 /TAXON_ID=33649 /ORGANISM="Thalassionema nitzschioides, Strain L26-B" /LENGTH=415 /DNA_ID=CAMNT_0038953091 /DNA_START=253 /DNA_END=1500 /DNA_ORIENTATION=-